MPAVLCSLAALLYLCAALAPRGIGQHWLIIAGSGVLAVAAGLALLSADEKGAAWAGTSAGWIIAQSASAVGIFSLIMWCGMRQFGGFDHSALIDPAWRIVCGQLPFRDFPCPLPPAFYLGAAWAFEGFGVSWRSLVLADAFFAAATFFWTVALLGQLVQRRRDALVLAVFVQATTTVLAAYWWYNPITAVTGVLFYLSAQLWMRRISSWFAPASYGLSLLLLAAMKPNVAGLLILGTSAILFSSPPHRWRVLAVSGGAAIAFLSVLSLCGLPADDILRAYAGIGGRGFSLAQFLQDMNVWERAFSLAVAGAALAPLFLRCAWRSLGPTQALGLVAALAGGYGFVTNGENKLMDVPLMLLGSWFFAFSGAEVRFRKWRAGQLLLAALLAGTGIGEALVRHRVKAIGSGAFFDFVTNPVPVSGGFFDGLHGSPVFVEVLKEVTEFLPAEKGAKIWFGPRMQWAYAAFGISPPLRQPSWWHPGVSYSPGEQPQLMEQWLQHRFEVLIFLGSDGTYLPDEMLSNIKTGFTYAGNGKLLTILKRRPEP
jgi:hypothetical protein